MSPRKKKKVTGHVADPQQVEDQDALNCRRDKLLADISSLRLLLSKVEAAESATRFRDIVLPEKSLPKPNGVRQPPDPQIALRTELYALAGISAKKFGDRFVFGFGRGGTINGGASSYWIQVWSESGEDWRVERWCMPISVDVAALLRDYPLNSPHGIKRFLRECKRHVDCYYRRELQCRQLETFVGELNLRNCSVQADPGFTRVALKLTICGVGPEPSNTGRLLVVDLRYRSNATRPARIIVEGGDSNLSLDEEEIAITRPLLKAFKEHDLREAAVRIFTSENSENVWMRSSPDDLHDALAELEQEDEIDTILSHLTNESSRSRKRRERTSESDVTSDDEIAASGVPSVSPSRTKKRKKPATDLPTSRRKQKNVKKSSGVKRDGKNREFEDQATETKEKRQGRVAARKKSVKKSSSAGQAKLSRYFSPGKNRQGSSPAKSSKDRVAATRGGVASTPIVGRVTRLHLEDDISEIVRHLDKNDDDENDAEEEEDTREITIQPELLRDVRAVHFAIDHVGKAPKRNKAPSGARRKSIIKKK